MDLVELMLAGDENVRAHDSSHNLADSARSFLGCVAGWDDFTVEAASPAAERVLGAAMMIDPTIRGGRSARTVVLDVNIASGTLVANAARRVREEVQSEWLIAVVINTLTDADMRWSIEGIDSLFVCGGSSNSGESHYGSQQSLSVHTL
ncbi:hypothetical protein WJX64_06915 [Leifsonia sp. YIM 134122]|uniref:Uncharacterized protein n=1 Tax=Leifsonia stereocauli TaxID=3134136 RepID=A0ABU9W337_9MICO